MKTVLANDKNIKLEKVVFVPNYKSNLILLGELWDNRIIYNNNVFLILLVQKGLSITDARKVYNQFILDFAIPQKFMWINANT